MNGCPKKTFIEELKKMVGEFILIIIKSGSDCCKEEGVLCRIEEDFLVLINDYQRTEILLNSIVGIKRSIPLPNNNNNNNNNDDCC